MYRWLMLMAGTVLLVLLTGCPYVVSVPVATPDGAALDSRLFGVWAATGADGDSLGLVISPFNENECFAEVWLEEGPSLMRLFAFEVNGTRFLHLNELQPDTENMEYFIARYEFPEDSRLVIQFISDAIVPEDLAESPAAFVAFLKKHLDDPALYDGSEVITVVREE